MSSFRRSAVGSVLFAIPPVTRTIILVTLAIWLVQLVTMSSDAARLATLYLALVSEMVLHRYYIWQLVTYQFLHDPVYLGHVAFNLYSVWLFGRDLEVRWGGWRYLRFYLTCGVGAGLLHVLLTETLVPSSRGFVIGASGSVMGLFMAYALIWPRRRMLFMFIIPMEMRHVVILMAGIELLLAWRGPSGVANLAHLGGLLTGWLLVRHAWRLGAVGKVPGRLWGGLAGLRRARRRSRMRVVDKDFDSWLRDNDDDSTRH